VRASGKAKSEYRKAKKAHAGQTQGDAREKSEEKLRNPSGMRRDASRGHHIYLSVTYALYSSPEGELRGRATTAGGRLGKARARYRERYVRGVTMGRGRLVVVG